MCGWQFLYFCFPLGNERQVSSGEERKEGWWLEQKPSVSPWLDIHVSSLYLQSYFCHACVCFIIQWAKYKCDVKGRSLMAIDQPNWMQLQPKDLTENVSHQWALPKWQLYASCPILLQRSQWPAIDFFLFLSCLCSLVLYLVPKCKFYLACCCCLCKGYFPEYMQIILQVLSAKVYGWDFSNGSVSILAAQNESALLEEFSYWSQHLKFDYSWGFLCLYFFQRNLWTLHQTPTQPWYQSCRVSCRKINASLVLAVPKRRQLLKLEIY